MRTKKPIAIDFPLEDPLVRRKLGLIPRSVDVQFTLPLPGLTVQQLVKNLVDTTPKPVIPYLRPPNH